MSRNRPLVVLSLLTLVLLSLHLTHDTIRQAEGSMQYPIPVAVFALVLYATLMAAHRVWGLIVMLLGGLFGAAMIVVHAKGVVVGNSGGFFFTWTLFALAATGWVTMVLAARGIWLAIRARRRRAPIAAAGRCVSAGNRRLMTVQRRAGATAADAARSSR